MSCQQSQEAGDEKWNVREEWEDAKEEGSLTIITGRKKWIGVGRRRIGETRDFQQERWRGGKKVSNPATHSFPFILLQFCRLCPLSSFTFTLHPARVDLVASDEWRGSDAVYRIGLRGLGVSAVCKVASAVWYNMAGLLATKLVAAAALRPYYGLGAESLSICDDVLEPYVCGSYLACFSRYVWRFKHIGGIEARAFLCRLTEPYLRLTCSNGPSVHSSQVSPHTFSLYWAVSL